MAAGKGPLRIAIEDFIETFGFGKKISEWLKGILETWENEAIDEYQKLTDALGITSTLPQSVSPKGLRDRVAHQIGLVAIILPIMLSLGQQITLLVIVPFLRGLGYASEALAHTKHPDLPDILRMLKRNPENDTQLRNFISGTGYDKISLDGYESLIRQYMTPLDYERLKLRGAISEQSLAKNLKELFYSDDDIKGIDELAKIIPATSDLILMAVREAFDDGVSAKFKHDENLPGEFVEWSKKIGLSEDWAKKYWRSHWQLPSPSQVFEMLHRLRPGTTENPIIQDDVNTFLRTADYAPFWRDRLAEISYSPFTRVDVRRMYKTGVLNESEVKEAYLDLGYDEKHAQALTEFTIAYEAEEETGVVRSSVLQAYGDGMIDRSTAERMLSGGGYDSTTIAFYLDNVDFRETMEVNQIKLANIKKRFVEGIIDETTVNSEINILNLPGERVTALLALWVTERENQTALLTTSQMETLLERGIVTADDYKRIAKRRGYNPESIEWTMKRIAQEASERAKSEAEKAASDNERVQKSKASSRYQKDKSEIDLAIAQARSEITDIDVALHGDIEVDEQITLAERKDELKSLIGQLNVTKAQLRFDVQNALDKLVG